RIVEIRFQQVHVFFGLSVLLLKKTLPIVFVPHTFRLAPIAGHAELNASFPFRAKSFPEAFLSTLSFEFRWLHQALQSLGSAPGTFDLRRDNWDSRLRSLTAVCFRAETRIVNSTAGCMRGIHT